MPPNGWLSPEWAMNASRIAWLVLIVFWILMARSGKKTEWRESIASRSIYSAIMAAGFVVILNPFSGWPGAFVLPRTSTLLVVAIVLNWAGAALAIWARICLGSNWSAVVSVKQTHELIRSGPYRLTRHPIYAGLLVASAGLAVMADCAQALLGLGLIAFAFWIKSRKEDRAMEGKFGAEYREYRKQVLLR